MSCVRSVRTAARAPGNRARNARPRRGAPDGAWPASSTPARSPRFDFASRQAFPAERRPSWRRAPRRREIRALPNPQGPARGEGERGLGRQRRSVGMRACRRPPWGARFARNKSLLMFSLCSMIRTSSNANPEFSAVSLSLVPSPRTKTSRPLDRGAPEGARSQGRAREADRRLSEPRPQRRRDR